MTQTSLSLAKDCESNFVSDETLCGDVPPIKKKIRQMDIHNHSQIQIIRLASGRDVAIQKRGNASEKAENIPFEKSMGDKPVFLRQKAGFSSFSTNTAGCIDIYHNWI